MNRFRILSLVLLLVLAASLSAHSPSSFTVTPSEMKDGETKTLVDGETTITVRRDGSTVSIKIDKADETKTITINRLSDGRISIGRGKGHTLLFGPDRKKIVIEGMTALEGLPELRAFRHKSMESFRCPKDDTVLRVPKEKAEQTFKCPVDGTVMEKSKTRVFTPDFDYDFFFGTDL